jgi:phage tail-like protein
VSAVSPPGPGAGLVADRPLPVAAGSAPARSRRGTVPGLPTPHPIAGLLPAVYQEEDPFAVRFTAGLDEVLAPVLATLDCLDAYVDPLLAPEDFLDWLAGWVGAVLDENVPLALRRSAVAGAAALHRRRGTVAGLRSALELLTGGTVDVADSGGAAWSATPGGVPPGESVPWVAIRVVAPPGVAVRSVEAVVAAAKPAHVKHSVEVVNR